LLRFWGDLDLTPGAGVLVPLCGKSLDMIWLREQGHGVLGVELSRLALEDFIREQSLECDWENQGDFAVAQCGALALYCGDYFALNADQLASVTAVYDRAALIALPSPMRKRYVAHLRACLPVGWQLLLVTLDYQQQERAGPPFSVPDAEVRDLFEGCTVSILQEEEVLDQHAVFKQEGMTGLIERVYLILAD
jgi:thiopurine S-methyltransferase